MSLPVATVPVRRAPLHRLSKLVSKFFNRIPTPGKNMGVSIALVDYMSEWMSEIPGEKFGLCNCM